MIKSQLVKGFGSVEKSLDFQERRLQDIERGYCGMSVETMTNIANCLGISLDYLVLGEEDGQELPGHRPVVCL